MSNKRFIKFGYLSGLCLVLASGARAQAPSAGGDVEAELMALLNTPVVTATRSALGSGRVPAAVATITADQIQRRKYRSLADVLRDLPDFKIDTGFSSEYYNTVTVRGVMGQYKFVILLDGARIGAATNEVIPVMENFPVHHAKQIEVVYGPASALYGADAFTGIINIVTFKGDEAVSHNNYRLSYGDSNQNDVALSWTGSLGGRTFLSVGVERFSDDRPDMPKSYPDEYKGLAEAMASGIFNTVYGVKHATIPYDPKYSQPVGANNVFLRLQQETWSLMFNQSLAYAPSAVCYAPPNALPVDRARVAIRTLSISASKTASLADNLDLQSALTARKYEVDPGSQFINMFHPNIEPGYKYAVSNSVRLEEVLNWQASKVVSITTGGSWETSAATPWGANLASPVDTGRSVSNQGIMVVGAPILADFYDIRSTSYGAFLQGQVMPTDQWSFTLGARYDKDSRYGSTFNPRVGVVYTPSSTTTVKLLYGTAFLAPSPYSAYRHYGGFFTTDGGQTYKSAYWRLPNPGLKPEKANTLELGFRQFLTSSLSLSLSVYRSEYKDLHTPMADDGNTNLYHDTFKGWPVDYIEVTGNAGKQTNLGGSLQVDYLKTFGGNVRLNVFSSFSHVDGKVENAAGFKTDIGYATPNLLKAGFDLSKGGLSLSPVLQVVGTQRSNAVDPADPARRLEIPGYKELNVVASYTYRPGLEAFLRVNNALDARYKNLNENAFNGGYEFNGVPQEPRRWALGLRGTF